MTVLDDINIAREGVDQETVDAVRTVGERYKYGFSSDIETEYAPKGLNEDIVRLISEKNSEPEWLLDWGLQAFPRWKTLKEPTWAMVNYPKIEFQDQTSRRERKALSDLQGCKGVVRLVSDVPALVGESLVHLAELDEGRAELGQGEPDARFERLVV